MSRLSLRLIVCALVVLVPAGCGGPAPTATDSASPKTPPPRPGEDSMKEAMEKLLQKKGKPILGVPKSPAKRS